ncbi:MAG: hypothetical protein H7Z13_04690 [Ferruginibacter sp.]|nr:hypothetical protein [Ferruginibacter sp.]
MKKLRLIALGCLPMISLFTYAQKTISEGTITYEIGIQSKNNNSKAGNGLNGAKTTVYLKGGLSRTEMTSTLGTETTIYNVKTGNAAILKEYSGQKLMITLTKENWEAMNKKFDGIVFTNAAETKIIEGYNCKRAFAQLKDGSSIAVYYTPDLIAMNKEYSQAFKNLPGFPMEYEFETEKIIFRYRISDIDFSPLPATKFDFPKSGYRIMTYDENKGGKAEGQ